MSLADTLTEENNSDEMEGNLSEEDDEPMAGDSEIVLAHFKDAGLLFTEEGEENWVVFLTCSLNSKIKLTETRSNGIVVTWDASPPSDDDIISVQDITSLKAREMNLHDTSCSLFIPSPRPISQDSSKFKSGLSPKSVEAEDATWLVISIPFAKEKEVPSIETGPVNRKK